MAKKKKSILSKEIKLPLPKSLSGGKFSKSRRIRLPRYFREALQEIKKVTWPNRKETWKWTFAVLVFTAVMTVFIIIADIIFQEIAERVFL